MSELHAKDITELVSAYHGWQSNPEILRLAREDERIRTAAYRLKELLSPSSPPEADTQETEQQDTDARRAKIIQWAGNIYDRYPPGASESQEFVKSHEQELRDLVRDPEGLSIAATVWQGRLPPEQITKATVRRGKSKPQTLIERASLLWVEEMKRDWQSVTEDQLTRYVTESVHNPTCPNVFDRLLKAYFEGPEIPDERIRSYATFASSAIGLANNPNALRKALEIAYFQNNAILPARSQYQIDIFSARFLSLADEQANDLSRVWNADIVLSNLADLAGIPRHILENCWDGITTLPQYKTIQKTKLEEAISYGMSRDAYAARIDLMSRVTGIDRQYWDPEQYEEIKHKWPYYILFDNNDPLKQKFFEGAGYKILPSKTRRHLEDKARERTPSAQPHTISLLRPGGYMVSICFPDNSSFHNRQDVIALVDEDMKQNDHVPKKQVVSTMVPVVDGYIIFERRKIDYFYYLYEQDRTTIHDIVSLEKFGFPRPVLAESHSLAQASREKSDHIAQSRSRFLDHRGIVFRVTEEVLRDRGFEYVIFRKDPDDNRQIVVTIAAAGALYDLKLDEYMCFDPEGKKTNDAQTLDSIMYWLLNMVDPFLTAPAPEQTDDRRVTDGTPERPVITRVGHFRRIGEKQPSETAIQNFIEIEGFDFHTAVARWRASNPGYDGNITYVKPTYAPGREYANPVEVENITMLPFAV
jgi:hypothetical protein